MFHPPRLVWPVVPVVTAGGIYPAHLTYLSEMACLDGHTDCIVLDGGARADSLFDNSNLDWRQGLEQLKTWIGLDARERTVPLPYFGFGTPAAYCFSLEPSGLRELLILSSGLYVVSGHCVTHISRRGTAWLRETRPTAVIEHSSYVYERR